MKIFESEKVLSRFLLIEIPSRSLLYIKINVRVRKRLENVAVTINVVT